MEANYFTILYWFCHTLTWICHRCIQSAPSWTPLPPPCPSHPSGSSQCTSPEHPVSCVETGLAIRFTYDNLHVSVPFSHILPPFPSPTESKRLFYTSVSLLLSRTQGYHYHLSKFHISVFFVCLFHMWYYTCFNAILTNHPILSLSHRVQKTVLCICISFIYASVSGSLIPSLAICTLRLFLPSLGCFLCLGFFLILLFGSNFLVVIFNSFYFISEISLFFQLFQDAFKMFIEWVFLQLL